MHMAFRHVCPHSAFVKCVCVCVLLLRRRAGGLDRWLLWHSSSLLMLWRSCSCCLVFPLKSGWTSKPEASHWQREGGDGRLCGLTGLPPVSELHLWRWHLDACFYLTCLGVAAVAWLKPVRWPQVDGYTPTYGLYRTQTSAGIDFCVTWI